MIADQRRSIAQFLDEFTTDQLGVQSLCGEWTVHDVAGHLIVPLQVGLPRFAWAVLTHRGNFDRANAALARQEGARPINEIAQLLRAGADSRFTPPGHGPLAPLTDLLVHSLDMCWPLGINRALPDDAVRAALDFLASPQAKTFVPRGALADLSLRSTNLDWNHGAGRSVSGPAASLMMAMTGRPAALSHLTGEGVPILRERLTR